MYTNQANHQIKIAVVVLMHNQAANLPKILPAYQAQAQQPDLYVFVLDRCTDSTEQDLKRYDGIQKICVTTENADGFCAGANRNLGLQTAQEHLGPCNVVFIDGDCIPTPGLVAAFCKVLSIRDDFPIVATGRRINTTETGDTVEDNRIQLFTCRDKVFAPSANRVLIDNTPVCSRLATWSCCLGLNTKAVDILCEINRVLGDSASVFNSAFNAQWGGEDDFIGIEAAYAGAAIVTIAPENYVTHIWHKSRSNTTYRAIISKKVNQLRSIALRSEMPGVLCMRTCHGNAIQKARVARITNEPFFASLAADALHLTGPARSAVLATNAIAVAATASEKAPKQPDEFETHWKLLRDPLYRLRTSVISAETAIEKAPPYTFTFPKSTACPICGSSQGYDTDSKCLNCKSGAEHRLAATQLDVSGVRVALNIELPCEYTLTQDWILLSENMWNSSHIPCESHSIDCLWLPGVLGCTKDDASLLQEIHRVLKPNGKAVISEPTADWETETCEDPSSSQDRLKYLGCETAYRKYGSDAAARFALFGFDVRIVTTADVGNVSGVSVNDKIFVLHSKQKQHFAHPTNLYLDVVATCNYKCRHCNNHREIEREPVDMNLYRSAIEQFSKLGGEQLDFAYGEPMLQKQIVFALAKHARKHGLRVDLVSNGTGFGSDIKDIVELFSSITFSVDGDSAEKHDAIRGVPGAFARVMSAVSAIRSFNVRPGLTASCVLIHSEVPNFRTYAFRMKELGFDKVSFTVLEPTFGPVVPFRADTYFDTNRLRPEDADILKQQLKGLNFVDVPTVDLIYDFIKTGVQHEACDSSFKNVIVNRNGDIRLCYGKKAVGSLRNTELFTVLAGIDAAQQRSENKLCTRTCGISRCHRKRNVHE